MNKISVKERMGHISLSFMWMSTDRTIYRYTNDVETSKTFAKWNKFKPQLMKGPNHFVVAMITLPAPGSKSGYSYDILGVLGAFSDFDEMRSTNAVYWELLQNCSTDFEKLEATFAFSEQLKKWYDDNDASEEFNMNTHLLLQLCTEGNLKEAKKLSKEFTK